MHIEITTEVQYMLVVVGLFIVPQIVQRFRIPSALTCVAMGAILGMGFHLFHEDKTIPLLATFGIVALFLFAGLEVDFSDLRKGMGIVVGHLVLQASLLTVSTFFVQKIFLLKIQAAFLFSLAVLTPSTGFILDSLGNFHLSDEQKWWVKTKAIASEMIALGALFITTQSTSTSKLAISSMALIGMIAILPTIFRLFAKLILPFAPKSEFAFLVIIAFLCAYLTRHLGVYYLVGAFVVGVTAVQLRKSFPELASERTLGAIELFAGFFIPVYFFKAGLHLEKEYFTLLSVGLGIVLVGVSVPIRILFFAMYRQIVLRERFLDSVRVSFALVPTLVFTIVISDILQDRYELSPTLYGALIVFTLVNTLLPGFILKKDVLSATVEPSHINPKVDPIIPELTHDELQIESIQDASEEIVNRDIEINKMT